MADVRNQHRAARSGVPLYIKIGGGADNDTGGSQEHPQPPKLVRLTQDRDGANDHRDLEKKSGLIATIVDRGKMLGFEPPMTPPVFLSHAFSMS